jgi:hypothetical protein
MAQTFPVAIFEKDPLAVIDFTADWSRALPAGDQIALSETIVPDGITLQQSGHVGQQHVFWLAGGEDDKSYLVTSKIISEGGRQDRRTIIIICRPT